MGGISGGESPCEEDNACLDDLVYLAAEVRG